MADATTNTAPAQTPTKQTGPRVLLGVVTSDKMNKTRRVEVSRLGKHPKYGKYIKSRTICYVHDDANASHLGDSVEIKESRPLSKTKRWTLERIIVKAPSRAVAALEGAVAGSTVPEATGEVKT